MAKNGLEVTNTEHKLFLKGLEELFGQVQDKIADRNNSCEMAKGFPWGIDFQKIADQPRPLIDQEFVRGYQYYWFEKKQLICKSLSDLGPKTISVLYLLFYAIRNNNTKFPTEDGSKTIQHYPEEKKHIEKLLSDPNTSRSNIRSYNNFNRHAAIWWLIDWWLTFMENNGDDLV